MYARYIDCVPVLTVPDALGFLPKDHIKGSYYYDFGKDSATPPFMVNTARNQWYADKEHHGYDAISLIRFFQKTAFPERPQRMVEDELVRVIADYEQRWSVMPQRIATMQLPLLEPELVVKPLEKAINFETIRGMSEVVLEKYCCVIYKAKGDVDEDSPEVRRLYKIIKQADDLHALTLEQEEQLLKLFDAHLAIKNVHSGYERYSNNITWPAKAAGFCHICDKDETISKGELCYVYENIVDFLALMELRHQNKTEFLLPSAHHVIINNNENLSEALEFLHSHCDYMDIICMFPNDDWGHKLLDMVMKKTNGTAIDGSKSYVNNHFFSLSGQLIGRKDEAAIKADHDRAMAEVNAEAEKLEKEKEAQKAKEQGKSQAPDLSKNEKEEELVITSAPKMTILEQGRKMVRKIRKGLRM